MEPRIVEYDPSLAKHFADLNYEWIAKHYGIEEHDHEQLDHPAETIIQPGGQIFFVLVGDEVAGTVAMIKMPDTNSFELAKMAVAPRFQGRKLGDLLMRACVDLAKHEGSDSIILESNTKQTAAVSLYRKYGFKQTPLDPNSQFVRANIRMQLDITDPRA